MIIRKEKILKVVKNKLNITSLLTLNAYIEFLESTSLDTTMLKELRKSLEQDLLYVEKLKKKITELQKIIRKLKK